MILIKCNKAPRLPDRFYLHMYNTLQEFAVIVYRNVTINLFLSIEKTNHPLSN